MAPEMLSSVSDLAQWQTSLSQDWDVLGPFPIHAREQHFLSPGFPLELAVPYNHEPNRIWPSSYANDAQVTWTKAQSDDEGNLAVSFPDIRWSNLRATEGWAALQHHSVLRTTLTIIPPSKTDNTASEALPPRLVVDLKQGSFFTILPRERDEGMSAPFTPEWHVGNIYAMLRAPPNSVELPGTVYTDKSTVYDFFVSGDYEIRLFGDPRDDGEETPTVRMNLKVSMEERHRTVTRKVSHDVVCDFVDGYAFGDGLGVGLRSLDGWWTVQDIKLPNYFPEVRPEASKSLLNLSISLRDRQTLAPSQTRIIPLSIQQTTPFFGNELSFSLVLLEKASEAIWPPSKISVPVTIQLRSLSSWSASAYEAIRASFFATSQPTFFLAKPPMFPNPDIPAVPVLALHGAGVDVISLPFWADAIPRQKHSWIVMPTGRTEWNLDWHGPSAYEALATVRALSSILYQHWAAWTFPPSTKVVLLGHSNGGQGVWHLAAHYPDRVRAALPAAGYLNAQAYVPLTHARGVRFADPALRMVLESALVPDNNELFLGNIADNVPILALHGGNDTNVPTWHSREYTSISKSWGKGLNISFHEDKGQPHWYPEVFQGAHVRSFLESVLDPGYGSDHPTKNIKQFMLTVVDPAHSGSLHGWTIDTLLVPGRLSRLRVNVRDGATHVRTTNVRRFSLSSDAAGFKSDFVVDGVLLPKSSSENISQVFSVSDESGVWASETSAFSRLLNPPPGRAQNIFDTAAPLTIIIPSDPPAHRRAFSAALRVAHALDVYLKLDAKITLDTFAIERLMPGKGETSSQPHCMRGNLIVLGGAENAFARALLQDRRTEFGLDEDGEWLFRDCPLPLPLDDDRSLGILFTHPHPLNPHGAAVFIAGTDAAGLERALRVLPLRTGVAVPDWVIIGREAERLGAGGVVGAGVWDGSWGWSEAMSWMT